MRPSQAKQYLPFVQALAEGKQVETRVGGGDWRTIPEDGCHYFDHDDEHLKREFRIKPTPTPTLRPWRLEEVPVGAWIRSKSITVDVGIILGRSSASIRISEPLSGGKLDDGYGALSPSFDACLVLGEHSLDHGKTWLPCGVVD